VFGFEILRPGSLALISAFLENLVCGSLFILLKIIR